MLTPKRHQHEETRNIHLHDKQSGHHTQLHRTLSYYADDGLVGPFNAYLGYLAWTT